MTENCIPKGTYIFRVDPRGIVANFCIEDAGRLRHCTLPAACHTEPDAKGGYRWLVSSRSKTPFGPTRRWVECRREPVAEDGYRWVVVPGPRAPSLITRNRW
jgi:hypothetical protein